MLGKLLAGLRGEAASPALPVIGEAGLGRAVRIDPSMLAAVEEAVGEAVSPDLVITGQGVIEMADETSDATWLHRFYDDEHRMLQAMTTAADGGDVLEWSFYVPAGAEYPGVGETAAGLKKRLTKARFEHDGQPFERLWYEGEADQPAVEFTEVVYEEADMSDGRPLPQACMVYGREGTLGEVLLLAILTGAGQDASLERMIGTGLRPHHIGV